LGFETGVAEGRAKLILGLGILMMTISEILKDLEPYTGRFPMEAMRAAEYVRDAAINAILVLEQTGQMARAEVVEYFRSLFHGKLQRKHSYAWDGLVCAVADLPAPELLEEVRQAYAEGLVDEGVVDIEGVERDLAAPKLSRRERDTLITDAVGEMERWACLHRVGSRPKRPPEVEVPVPPLPPPTPARYEPPKPLIREPKIGRNDPCPCGSGKKYKKCCGRG
jgi:hypothetical protein